MPYHFKNLSKFSLTNTEFPVFKLSDKNGCLSALVIFLDFFFFCLFSSGTGTVTVAKLKL